MKVLYLDQSGQMGGGEVAILPWLVHERERASVLLFEEGMFMTRLQEAGVPVQVFDLGSLKTVRRESGLGSALSTLPALLRMRRELRAIASGFDVLYANSMKAFLVSCLVRRKGQPLVWHLRDILSPDHFSSLMRRIAVGFGNRFATVVIVNSKATADAFVEQGGRRDKVTLVYDGVSADAFQSDAATLDALRSSIGRPGRTLVGVFSRLSPWKGQLVMLEAASAIPEIDVVLVGKPLFGEEDYAEKLYHRAAQPDLEGRVHFLGFRKDVAELMGTMDIVAHTSTSAEPFGLVIVEGMLAGKPVIATRAGGAMEIVTDGETGLLVAPGSPGELREALLRLLRDPAEAKRLAANGQRHAEAAFPLDRLFRGLRAVLDRLGK